MDERDRIRSCENALNALTERLDQGEFTRNDLDKLIAIYPKCGRQLKHQYQMWNELSTLEVPEPSPQMDVRFYKMLSEAAHSQKQPSGLTTGIQMLSTWLNGLAPQAKWSMVAGIFIIGLFLGRYILPSTITTQPLVQIDPSRESLKYLTYAAAVTPISTFDRLKGIQMTKDVTNPDEKIYDALLHALLHDENINVRLSAVEALVYFADNPMVRQHLIHAIPNQTSPIVQMALADAMIHLHEKRSAKAWQELFGSEKVESTVKSQLKNTLETIL